MLNNTLRSLNNVCGSKHCSLVQLDYTRQRAYLSITGRRTFTHRTFTHRTVAHRTFTHRTVAHRTVAHLILHAYLILKRVLLANSTFIWYFNENRTHGCVERIVSVTGSACLPVCDAVLPKWAAVYQPILLEFLFLYGSDPIIVYGP